VDTSNPVGKIAEKAIYRGYFWQYGTVFFYAELTKNALLQNDFSAILPTGN